jgi:uncharacterized protein (UPF0332 family)
VDRFDDCLAKGRLKKIESEPEKAAQELRSSIEELERSRVRYGGGNWADASTQGYFAIYRAARAALYSRGYRDTNLYGLCAGLQRLFVDTEEMPAESIDMLKDAKEIKDVIYEGGRSSRHESRQVLLAAQLFVKRVLKALALPDFDPESVEITLPEVSERHRDRPPFPRDSFER